MHLTRLASERPVLRKEWQVVEDLIGSGLYPTSAALAQHTLRRKIEHTPSRPRYLLTERTGIGYRLAERQGGRLDPRDAARARQASPPARP